MADETAEFQHRIFAKHLPYDDGHLAGVVEEMQLAGAPTVHCVRWKGSLYAMTASHRLAAAKLLDLEPKVVLHEMDAGEDLDGFFGGVANSLPSYHFRHIHIMEPKFIGYGKLVAAITSLRGLTRHSAVHLAVWAGETYRCAQSFGFAGSPGDWVEALCEVEADTGVTDLKARLERLGALAYEAGSALINSPFTAAERLSQARAALREIEETAWGKSR